MLHHSVNSLTISSVCSPNQSSCCEEGLRRGWVILGPRLQNMQISWNMVPQNDCASSSSCGHVSQKRLWSHLNRFHFYGSSFVSWNCWSSQFLKSPHRSRCRLNSKAHICCGMLYGSWSSIQSHRPQWSSYIVGCTVDRVRIFYSGNGRGHFPWFLTLLK